MISISTRGLDNFQRFVDTSPRAARDAARFALNDTLRRARTLSIKAIQKQVAFPAGYLGNEKSGRLRISKYATGNNLTGEITGRFNPTSLARFTTNLSQMMGRNRKGPASVKVKPTSVRTIQRAFLIRLRRGAMSVEDAGMSANVGLAIRLKPGEKVQNKKSMKAFGKGVYLLYGPSVNQVFRDVAQDIVPDVSDYFASEFARQFARLTNV